MFCLDTNIVVFALNQRRPAISARLDAELRYGSHLMVPSMVRFELEYGYSKGTRQLENSAILSAFLAVHFDLIDFDHQDGVEAGQIRAELEKAGTPIGPYDAAAWRSVGDP
jgi:tRNA(fMet)-specific endonuclease VapC